MEHRTGFQRRSSDLRPNVKRNLDALGTSLFFVGMVWLMSYTAGTVGALVGAAVALPGVWSLRKVGKQEPAA